MVQESRSEWSGDGQADQPESGWQAWLDRAAEEHSRWTPSAAAPADARQFGDQAGGREIRSSTGGPSTRLNRAEKGLVDRIGDQRWLDQIADPLASAVATAFRAAGPARSTLANLLHGVWLGHPLHAAMVTVPVGSWTATTILDLLGLLSRERAVNRAADLTLTIGLVGASAAAIAGLADWHHTRGSTRRVGTVHALLNSAGALLNLGSLLARRSGHRTLGRALSGTSYVGVLFSAWLGGELSYNQRIGVNHADDAPASQAFKPVLAESTLVENGLERVLFDGVPVLLSRQNGHLFAIGDTCSHLGCSLASGDIDGSTVRCPCHGSRFALSSGQVVEGPALYPVPQFETRIKDGQIELRSR